MQTENDDATPKIIEEDKELERSGDSIPQDEAKPFPFNAETYSNNISNNSPEYKQTKDNQSSELRRFKKRKQSALKSVEVASNTIIVAKSSNGYNIYTSVE